MAGKEEVVVMTKQGHHQVPTKIKEGLQENTGNKVSRGWTKHRVKYTITHFLTPSVNTTPNFQIWYLISMEVTLKDKIWFNNYFFQSKVDI